MKEPELATEDPGLQGKGQISVYTNDYQVFIDVVWYCHLLSVVNESDLRILMYVACSRSSFELESSRKQYVCTYRMYSRAFVNCKQDDIQTITFQRAAW